MAEIISNYYKQEREEILSNLKDDKTKNAKIEALKKEIDLDWEKFLLLKQNAKNLRRKIMRQRILLRTLQNMKEIVSGDKTI